MMYPDMQSDPSSETVFRPGPMDMIPRVASNGVADGLTEDSLFQSKILVLDDDPSTTDIIRRNLLEAGFQQVMQFNSPCKAIEYLQNHPQDIALLDIRMPEIDGIRILDFLRNKKETQYLPVIVLTAVTDDKTRLAALNAGASDFVNKPVIPSELVARVKNALTFKHYADRIEQNATMVQRELDFDALTQLRNRRAFENYLGNEFSRDDVSDNMSLILFDIDNFKNTNDQFGHRAGDGILQQLAQIISESCTCDEFASRIGGDEFAIICHHEVVDRTRELAQRISNLIKQTPLNYKGQNITSTISIGIARRTPFTDTREKLFDHADAALYHSKRGGRDAISVYSEIEQEIGGHAYLKQKRRIPTREEGDIQDPRNGRILIIDDEPAVTKMLDKQLRKADYQLIEAEHDALKALDRINEWRPDLIILDIRMPGLNGLEILKRLRGTDGISSIPVLIMTSSSDDRIRMAALQLQANDFLTKPAKPAELAARVHNSLLMKFQHDQLREFSAKLRFEVEVRTNELFATRREAILCLARTAESRDTDTGQHVLRVGRYAAIIGRELGLDHDFVSWLELAAQLHDVGKIAIPDSILYKPGKLSDEEYEIMQTHCQQADRIFGGDAENAINACTSPLLQMAARIASSHHERWDGKGYPNGLGGEEIPIEGRITSVADVFDAISSKRHYKKAFDLDSCFRLLEQGRGTQFDPRVLDAFFSASDKIVEAMNELQDQVESDHV